MAATERDVGDFDGEAVIKVQMSDILVNMCTTETYFYWPLDSFDWRFLS